jgi:outer membrane lipoprotein-sorting protein
MKSLKDIQELVSKYNVKPRPEMRSKVLNEALEIQRERRQQSISDTLLDVRRIIMKSRITKMAAAAVIIMAVILGLNMIGVQNTAGVAWGAVVKNVESVKNVVSHLTTDVKMQGLPPGQTPKTTAIGYYSSENGSRVESYINDKLSFTMYLNPKENIFVSVMPDQKKFMKVTGKSPDELKLISEKDDPRVMVRHLMSAEYEQLGRDKINGIDVEGIECTGPGVMGGIFEDATARVWVEIGTDFPVRIEIEGMVAGGQMEMSMVIDDFQWNVELDPALFVPDIPSDYTSTEMNLSEVDEGTAINGLRLFAELSNGQYPSALALMTLLKEISEVHAAKYAVEFAEKEDYANATLATTQILPAASFYAQLVGKDAVYHGDRVTAGNPESVLLRWKVSEGVYRVVFGDLSTKNVSVEELAELEAAFPK